MRKLIVAFKKIFFLMFALLFLTQCISSGGVKGGANKKHEEFFIEGGHMQYYVSPQEYVSTSGNETIKADYTMRDSIVSTSNIVINFTFKLGYGIKELKQFNFVFDGERNSISDIERIYIEKIKKDYIIRYTGKIKYHDWAKTQQLSHTIKVILDDKEIEFEPTKKTSKSMKVINNTVVDIMNLSIENK